MSTVVVNTTLESTYNLSSNEWLDVTSTGLIAPTSELHDGVDTI